MKVKLVNLWWRDIFVPDIEVFFGGGLWRQVSLNWDVLWRQVSLYWGVLWRQVSLYWGVLWRQVSLYWSVLWRHVLLYINLCFHFRWQLFIGGRSSPALIMLGFFPINGSLDRTHSGAYFIINFTSLSHMLAWPQFSPNNVQKGGLRQHHLISNDYSIAVNDASENW